METAETSPNVRTGLIRPGKGRGRGIMLAVVVLAAGLAAPVASAQTASSCATVMDSKLPSYLEGWSRRSPIAAAASLQSVGLASLPLGVAQDAQLLSSEKVSYPVLPAKPGGPASFGGVFSLQIVTAGDYRVSLGSGAWIEVTKGEARVESTSHAEGPVCSSLRKTVIFPLKPGTYVLELSAASQPNLPVMVTQVQ